MTAILSGKTEGHRLDYVTKMPFFFFFWVRHTTEKSAQSSREVLTESVKQTITDTFTLYYTSVVMQFRIPGNLLKFRLLVYYVKLIYEASFKNQG